MTILSTNDLYRLIHDFEQPVIRFAKDAEELDDLIDQGMFGRVISAVDVRGEFLQVEIDLSEFEVDNDKFMLPHYYDKSGVASLTAKQAGSYPDNGRVTVFLEYAPDISRWLLIQPSTADELKDYILEYTQYNDGRDDVGYYESIDTMNDNGTELFLWKLCYSGYNCDKYQVIEVKNLHKEDARLFPKEINLVVSDERSDDGHALVNVDRRAGTATLVASERSSELVVAEQAKLAEEHVNKSALNHFVDYTFAITWKDDHYHIDHTHSADWRKGP